MVCGPPVLGLRIGMWDPDACADFGAPLYGEKPRRALTTWKYKARVRMCRPHRLDYQTLETLSLDR